MTIKNPHIGSTFESWLDELNGMVGSFSFDLDPWVRGSLPGTRTFKLTAPDDGWDAELAVTFGYNFCKIYCCTKTNTVNHS